jgi:hypothetical protein
MDVFPIIVLIAPRYAAPGRSGADRQRGSGSAPKSSRTSGMDSSYGATGAAIAASFIAGSDSGSLLDAGIVTVPWLGAAA